MAPKGRPPGCAPAVMVLLCAIAWSVVVLTRDVDPWLGANSALVCPLVCGGCKGPYRLHGYGYSGRGHRNYRSMWVFCHHPESRLRELSWLELMTQADAYRHYQVPFGVAVVVGSAVLPWLLLLVLVVMVFMRKP